MEHNPPPPSLKNVWKVYKQAGLEKSLELLISSHLICRVDESLTRVVSNLWATSANPTSGWSSAFLSGERRQRWREEGKEVRSDLAPLEEQRGTHSSALSAIIDNLFV